MKTSFYDCFILKDDTICLPNSKAFFLPPVSEALSRVRTEFLSVSKCQNLEQIETGSFIRLPDLKTLTLNQNPQLTYIAPGFLR